MWFGHFCLIKLKFGFLNLKSFLIEYNLYLIHSTWDQYSLFSSTLLYRHASIILRAAYLHPDSLFLMDKCPPLCALPFFWHSTFFCSLVKLLAHWTWNGLSANRKMLTVKIVTASLCLCDCCILSRFIQYTTRFLLFTQNLQELKFPSRKWWQFHWSVSCLTFYWLEKFEQDCFKAIQEQTMKIRGKISQCTEEISVQGQDPKLEHSVWA